MNRSTKLCLSMISELDSHKRDKETLLLEYINNRLDKSFESYTSDISSSLEYLERRDTINVMKKINRLYK